MVSSIAGSKCASSFKRRMVRNGKARASATACSFHPWPSSRSVARQMSTLDMEARITFSVIDRIAAVASSTSHTSTSIVASPAVIAFFTRRLPTSIVSPFSVGFTQGGWMIPTILMEATICSSIAGGTGVRRALFGLGRRVRGSTLRSSAMTDSSWLRFCPPCVLGRPLPRGASRSAGARARAARGQRPIPCGGGRRCASRFIILPFTRFAPVCFRSSCDSHRISMFHLCSMSPWVLPCPRGPACRASAVWLRVHWVR